MRTAIKYLKARDPVLRRLIEAAGPYNLVPPRGFTPYKALIKAITHQQLHGKAAETIYRRFLEIYSPNLKKHPTPEEILNTPLKRLRAAGLSQAKALGILDVALKTVEGTIPSSRKIKSLSDDEIISRLTSVRGVGKWTVQMLLMFQLGRLDVLPVDDYGVKKGFALAYKKPFPTPKELLCYGEKWKPYRSIASWYMWRAVDLQKTSLK